MTDDQKKILQLETEFDRLTDQQLDRIINELKNAANEKETEN